MDWLPIDLFWRVESSHKEEIHVLQLSCQQDAARLTGSKVTYIISISCPGELVNISSVEL
jgi:hypothetical protein